MLSLQCEIKPPHYEDMNLISVVCYNAIEFWKSRTRAIKFYKEAAQFCDGCEAERYTNIVWDLMDGKEICTDGESANTEYLAMKDKFLIFPNGTNIRDLTGKVECPTDKMGFSIK